MKNNHQPWQAKRNHLWIDIAIGYSVGLYLWREGRSSNMNESAYYQFLVCRELIRNRLPDEPRGLRDLVGREISEVLSRNAKLHPPQPAPK